MAGLLKELLVHPEGKISRIVDGNFYIITICQHDWMVGTIERHIVCSIPGIRYPDPLDHTHATGVNGVVTFHAHNHRNGWYIPENCNKVGMQRKEFISRDVNAFEEFKELNNQRIGKRIRVLWLLRTWNNSHAEDIV
jgi:hypothetical protein